MAAARFKGEPIAFIVVNSGNSRRSLSAYLRKNRVPFPAIVDTDRSFERACGVPTVSLNDILRVKLITGQGSLVSASPSDLVKAAERALEGASWNIEPAGIPATLKQAWLLVEFGNFAKAASAVQKNVKSRKPETKAAAERLLAYVHEKRNALLKSASDALQSDRKWDAFKTYNNIEQTFKGYEIPDEVARQIETLKADETIKSEILAQKQLQFARKALSSRSASARKRAIVKLKKIASKFPDTEAGSQAGMLAERIGRQ